MNKRWLYVKKILGEKNSNAFFLTGHFCPAGTTSTRPCPAGTFNPSTGLGLVSECLSCNPGQYCGGVGLNETSGNCSVGYFCSRNATTSSPNDGKTGLFDIFEMHCIYLNSLLSLFLI